MNILIVGNGFDLAHNLATKYIDFLNFIKTIRQVFNGDYPLDKENISPEIMEKIIHNAGNISNNLHTQEKLWSNLIDKNIWIDYFLNSANYKKENWIDFESEICNVIKSIDNDMSAEGGVRESIDGNMTTLSNPFLNEYYSEYCFTANSLNTITEEKCRFITYRKIRDELLRDLNKLIHALGIYLYDYVMKISVVTRSPDIEEINVDKILSFNYTDTFSKLYDLHKNIEYV